MDGRAIACNEDRNRRSWGQHLDFLNRGSLSSIHIADRRPREEFVTQHQPCAIGVRDVRTIGKIGQSSAIGTLDRAAGKTIAMELPIDEVGADRLAETGRPIPAEPAIIVSTAFGARTVSGGERCRLVEEKEFGVRVRSHDDTSDSAEFGETCDPTPHLRRANDAPMIVVQDTAVAHDQATAAAGDDLTERRDSILQRHRRVATG